MGEPLVTHKQLREEALRQSEVRAEFEKIGGEFALLDKVLSAKEEQAPSESQVPNPDVTR